jgi:7,8-dihydropterin-6-yl-methyl-4-(beta-D-ribofuranosyl)aminobenzene 5'-phosphate synthase
MRILNILMLTCLLLTPVVRPGQVPSRSLTITVLYDNVAATAGTEADWGFSCFVEMGGGSVLFDTGANPEVLRANINALQVDLSRINAVVFSHEHKDHTGGVEALGARPGLLTFFPASFGEAMRARFSTQGLRLMPVTEATAVLPGFATSKEMGARIREDALVVEIPDGLVVVVGCSHPGIVPMLRQISASRKRPVYMVLGGFHLLQTPEEEVRRIVGEFEALGVTYAGPTHCTGEAATELFREAYGRRFIECGVGSVVWAPFTKSRLD